MFLVHDNYEHPLQEEGEDQSEYTRLEYKSLRQNGNGNGKYGSNTKMGDLSSSTVAVKGNFSIYCNKYQKNWSDWRRIILFYLWSDKWYTID